MRNESPKACRICCTSLPARELRNTYNWRRFTSWFSCSRRSWIYKNAVKFTTRQIYHIVFYVPGFRAGALVACVTVHELRAVVQPATGTPCNAPSRRFCPSHRYICDYAGVSALLLFLQAVSELIKGSLKLFLMRTCVSSRRILWRSSRFSSSSFPFDSSSRAEPFSERSMLLLRVRLALVTVRSRLRLSASNCRICNSNWFFGKFF